MDEDDTAGSVKKKIREYINEHGNENIYKITLQGVRNREVCFDMMRTDTDGNVLEILDETRPPYDFERLYRENAGNIIGRYIERFEGCGRDSETYQALCEGVDALMKNRR